MIKQNQEIIVIKLNTDREETWRYPARVLTSDKTFIVVEAYFNRSDFLFNGILLKENDRFVERYYSDRWYNIFEIHDRQDDHLKRWYCNITLPAEFNPGQIAYVDLALDVLVYPNGEYLILDEEEFEALKINEVTRLGARQALDELVALVESGDLSQWENLNKDAL
jgi:predicted RNA-binding protein associated with RNAse of E/G family